MFASITAISPSTRRGFTIVEVLLALVLLAVGMLALVSTATMTTRAVRAGSRMTRGSAAAASRMEQLLAEACGGGASAGTTTAGDIRVDWTATPLSRLTEIVVVLHVRAPDGIRSDSFVSARACVP